MKALFDTNILIDYLNGEPQANTEFRRYDSRSISIVTWMEVMIGADPAVASATEAFLGSFTIVAVDPGIARRAVDLRRQHKMKLPDAIIWASAQAGDLILVTRNIKDFPQDDPGVRMPYRRSRIAS